MNNNKILFVLTMPYSRGFCKILQGARRRSWHGSFHRGEYGVDFSPVIKTQDLPPIHRKSSKR